VGVEVFFAHGQAFVGMRLFSLNAQARMTFLANTVSSLATGRWHVFAEVLAHWWRAQAGEGFRPGQAVPDVVDIGVVNAWHTIGPAGCGGPARHHWTSRGWWQCWSATQGCCRPILNRSPSRSASCTRGPIGLG
jgi:hypothetical protein